VSVILSKIVHIHASYSGFRHRDISLDSSKIVDKKEILRNTGIYCSSDKVGTVYLV
jgi:hypothetical protein